MPDLVHQQTLYVREKYHGKPLMVSFWHQLMAVKNTHASTMLEVGVGSGFTSTYLQQRGVDVTSVDIDPNLEPDVVGNVLRLPFADDRFDIACCFEVLEHLPFELFGQALLELKRVSRQRVILSLPDAGHSIYMGLRCPGLKPRNWLLPLHRLLPRRGGPTEPNHFWEINRMGCSLKLSKYQRFAFRTQRGGLGCRTTVMRSKCSRGAR